LDGDADVDVDVESKSNQSDTFVSVSRQASNFSSSSRVLAIKISRERLAATRLPSPPTDHQKTNERY
jgi:hypothetical protein